MIGVECGRVGVWPDESWYYGFGESVSKVLRTQMMVGLTVAQVGKLVSGSGSPELGGAGSSAPRQERPRKRVPIHGGHGGGPLHFSCDCELLAGAGFGWRAVLVSWSRFGAPGLSPFRERAQQVGVLFLVALMMMVWLTWAVSLARVEPWRFCNRHSDSGNRSGAADWALSSAGRNV